MGRKKSKAPMSLHTLRQATQKGPIASHLITTQDMPSAPPTVEAPASAAMTPATPAPSPLPAAVVQEVSQAVVEVVVPATQAESAVVPSSIVAALLLSASVATIGAPTMLPPSSSAPVVLLLQFWWLWRCLLRPRAFVSPLIIYTPLVMLTHCGVRLTS